MRLTREMKQGLDEVFTRAYYSAAGYVFESRPFGSDPDTPLLDHLATMRTEDQRHATLIANLIDMYDEVPEPGVFPYWHRDLNYLTVAYMTGFVVEALQEDLQRIDAAMAVFPEGYRYARTTLRTIRIDKQKQLQELMPLAVEARERDERVGESKIAAIKKTRAARIAKEKAAKAAARKAKAAGGGIDLSKFADPHEEGISNKEKAKRTVAILRAKKSGAAVAAPAAVSLDVSHLPDPDEEGISKKEKAKRTMVRKRELKKLQAQAASAPAPPAGGEIDLSHMPDPDEEGISAKEKAKRTMLRKRELKKLQAAGASAAPAAAVASADPMAGLPDPDEPGISAKEKAKRTMLRKRAQKKAEGG